MYYLGEETSSNFNAAVVSGGSVGGAVLLILLLILCIIMWCVMQYYKKKRTYSMDNPHFTPASITIHNPTFNFTSTNTSCDLKIKIIKTNDSEVDSKTNTIICKCLSRVAKFESRM